MLVSGDRDEGLVATTSSSSVEAALDDDMRSDASSPRFSWSTAPSSSPSTASHVHPTSSVTHVHPGI